MPLQRIAEPAAGSRAPGQCLVGKAPDDESLGWLRALSSEGYEHEDAVERLHALLLRAARFEVARRRRTVAGGGIRSLASFSTV